MRRIIAAATLVVLTACGGPAERRADEGARANEPTATAERVGGGGGSERTAPRRNVVFVGTSLTAGYGIGHDAAYPALIQQKVDSAGLPFRVLNAGISGETSAAGLRRIDWVLQQPVDVLVLELGANDGLRGIDPDLMRRNLTEILERTRARYPDAALVVVGMEAPPNLGDAYTSRFRRVFSDLAREYDAALVPFLLEGVAAERSLNIDDGIHPNHEGHRVLAATVWRVLAPLLEQRVSLSEG